MQRCPKCNRTYQDDSQKFCTFDGGRLMVDAQAPTTFDLGPAPQTDPLGATVMGPAPDLNKTVAGAQPPLTKEIPPSAPTGPTTGPAAPGWPPTVSAPPPTPPASTAGPTTTSPLVEPRASSQSSPPPSSGGLAGGAAQPQSDSFAPASGQLGATPMSPVAPPQKTSKLPLVMGALAVLLLLVLGGGAALYFFALKPKVETANSNSGGGPALERGTNSTGRTGSGGGSSNANGGGGTNTSTVSQPPVTPPPNSTKFVNAREKLTGSLAEHFLDFSLYYPNGWALDPKAAASGNFFRADRMLSDDTGDYLLERAAISWYQSNGTMQLDRPIFPNRVEHFNNQFAKDYPNYEKVSEGETKFNGLEAYQFTFKGLVKDTGKGDVNLWGRVIFLPTGSEDSRNGIVLLMLASSAAPDVKSIEDVGERGELPTILKTFRLGTS
jgi:hypothetical protein